MHGLNQHCHVCRVSRKTLERLSFNFFGITVMDVFIFCELFSLVVSLAGDNCESVIALTALTDSERLMVS
jgi:hypothetical protein